MRLNVNVTRAAAFAVVGSQTVTALIVAPPAYELLFPDKTICKVLLFWIMPVTLLPITALMVKLAAEAFEQEFVIVPV